MKKVLCSYMCVCVCVCVSLSLFGFYKHKHILEVASGEIVLSFSNKVLYGHVFVFQNS